MALIVEYTLNAVKDIDDFKKHGEIATLEKIRRLVEAIQQSPFEGIGKPEPLKYALTGLLVS